MVEKEKITPNQSNHRKNAIGREAKKCTSNPFGIEVLFLALPKLLYQVKKGVEGQPKPHRLLEKVINRTVDIHRPISLTD